MNDIHIDNANVSKATRFLLKLDINEFQKNYQEEARALMDSLKVGWEAYNNTQVNFIKGNTEINISDNYLEDLISAANSLYKLLEYHNKQAFQSYLK